MWRALITGITGQDGSYLAEHLLSQGYAVYGLVRGQQNARLPWLRRHLPEVHLVEGDLMDQSSLVTVIDTVTPDEVYNLAAVSFVPISWKQPELVAGVTGLGVLRLLEAIRIASGGRANGVRFYQASSSEMFGRARQTPQSEETPFHPRSPYGVAKIFGHHITVNYRESYGLFACSGILFNHESPRRGLEFATRKITAGAARIRRGLQKELPLGNLEARRDWGYAGDYVRAMHLMLQQPEPDDYVIGTGESHLVREFVEVAFRCAGLDWRDYVRIDPALLRPAEVQELRANPSKARRGLGWRPTVSFEELVRLMVEHDLDLVARGDPALLEPAVP